MGDTSEHLTHSGKFFSLDELFFQALDLGDVATGDDYTFDFSGFVN